MPAGSRTSFVIASRNRSEELAAVLRLLLDTTQSPIILVDNASRDDSVAVANHIAAGSGRRLTVIELPDNLGAVGRNVGVAHCSTPYVAFCDDDSWWEPDAPAIAEEVFDAHPSVAVLAGRTLVWPDMREDPIVAELADSPLGRDPALPGPSILGFQACSAMVRKSAFQAVGGFSPILHFRGEEQLLAVDLATIGWDLCFCDRLTAYHRPSALRAPSSAEQARVLRNTVLTAWLRRPLRRCVQSSADFAWAAARDRAHAAALAEALRAVPAVISARHRLPAPVERAVRTLETS
ncbi:glycosyltransferase [Mycobacterium sp. ITM-2016-00317]|uniref:glycosyltransferase family 2 protein n=1 Tax=Mycobacterium sp. ITM-2016-00317 TaxID=2099694 RepID=UPI000D44C2F6|nr:glycosyltransferase [Mycobacterium sp. ITM-2016-00317]WNG90116.1 glycosyltransferase [Mycobacterium sp. ITM-2016-00317]